MVAVVTERIRGMAFKILGVKSIVLFQFMDWKMQYFYLLHAFHISLYSFYLLFMHMIKTLIEH